MTQQPQASGIPRPPLPGERSLTPSTQVLQASVAAGSVTLDPITSGSVSSSHEPPLKDVLVELWQNVEKLLRQEVALASAEFEIKAQKLKAELTASAIGAGLALAGTLALVAAVILILALFMPAWLAALLTSGATLGGGVALLKAKRPSLSDIKPERSLHSIEKDLRTFTEASK